jgi:hypothetical protein
MRISMRVGRLVVPAAAFALSCGGNAPMRAATTAIVIPPASAPAAVHDAPAVEPRPSQPTGTVLWRRFYGGAGRQEVFGGAVSKKDGRILLLGAFDTSATFGATTLAAAPGATSTSFLAWFDAEGNALQARAIGSALPLPQVHVAIAPDGDTIVAGTVGDGVDLGTGPMRVGADRGVFVARLGQDGAPRWLRRFGGSASYAVCLGLAASADGTIAITGTYAGDLNLGTGALPTAHDDEGFVAELEVDGRTRWSERLNGRWTDPWAVAFDASGALFVAGAYQGMDLGLGPLPPTRNGGDRAVFAAKLDRAGHPVWNRGFVGAYDAHAIGVDGSGAPVLVGMFQHDVQWDGGALTGSGMNNGYAVALAPDGATRWVKNLGTGQRGELAADAIVAADGGEVFVGGERVDDFYRMRFATILDAQGAARWGQFPASGRPVGATDHALILAGSEGHGDDHVHITAIAP